MSKVNRATRIVQNAQAAYPKNLDAVAKYFGPIPYGVQQLDSRTVDKQLLQMGPDQMAQMAMSDPMQAERAAARIDELNKRAADQTPLPGQGQYEGPQDRGDK